LCFITSGQETKWVYSYNPDYVRYSGDNSFMRPAILLHFFPSSVSLTASGHEQPHQSIMSSDHLLAGQTRPSMPMDWLKHISSTATIHALINPSVQTTMHTQVKSRSVPDGRMQLWSFHPRWRRCQAGASHLPSWGCSPQSSSHSPTFIVTETTPLRDHRPPQEWIQMRSGVRNTSKI